MIAAEFLFEGESYEFAKISSCCLCDVGNVGVLVCVR